ncbi:putative membrane protein [Nocardioides sp. J9]|uniref:DUF2243 domain-containing protein n=1 Tax=Nocardioides sp. J9 TaxID=935844 RepID=UPI0011A01D82|nr:DUF2243 domain-containing protein [Nocardioides sp. J9]TWG96355.1 putative membrane protein [Nocardioides sp. J9]
MTAASSAHLSQDTRPTRAVGLLYGIGFGAFVDGIVLHQLLQWHHMVSHVDDYPTTTVAGLEANTLADGLFHAVAWVCLLAAAICTFRAWRAGRLSPRWSFHVGLALAGWGLFNLVEGLVDHHLLGVHHVRDDLSAPLAWDLGFLALGAVLVAGGWLLHRAGADRVGADRDGVSST